MTIAQFTPGVLISLAIVGVYFFVVDPSIFRVRKGGAESKRNAPRWELGIVFYGEDEEGLTMYAFDTRPELEAFLNGFYTGVGTEKYRITINTLETEDCLKCARQNGRTDEEIETCEDELGCEGCPYTIEYPASEIEAP